jgi:zinc transport system permease protein
MLTDAMQALITQIATALDLKLFEVSGLLAVLLVSGICGAVSPLVVGSRMAFFSDAMAHCAIAGVTLGLLTALTVAPAGDRPELNDGLIVGVMVALGVAVGLGIAYVREKTALASDTVIGVFFAGAIGFGGVLYAALAERARISPEVFLFGSPIFVSPGDLLRLIGLAVLTAVLLVWRYNQFVFASFNPSLARSRRIPLRLYNYAFIVLLNALLVVPAATASNLSGNLRQMFWLSLLLSLGTGLGGLFISTNYELALPDGATLKLAASPMIVVLNVLCFFGSMVVAWLLKRGPTA